MVDGEKVRTSVYIPKQLHEKAKALGINLSDVLSKALVVEISLKEREIEEFQREYLRFTVEEKAKKLGKIDSFVGSVLEEGEIIRDDESGAP